MVFKNYIGIRKQKISKRWSARIKNNGIQEHLGVFDKMSEAINAFDTRTVEIKGEHAITNKKLIQSGLLPPIPTEFDYKAIEIDNLPNEIWKEVPNFNGRYFASNLGRIKSVYFYNGKELSNQKERPKIFEENLLKGRINRSGYLQITMVGKDRISKTYTIHRIIGITFIPNPENKPQINHIDFNKLNNNILNLEWLTDKEHKEYTKKCGKLIGARGEKNSGAKLNTENILFIRNNVGKYSRYELAEKFKIKPNHVSRIVNREAWKHIP